MSFLQNHLSHNFPSSEKVVLILLCSTSFLLHFITNFNYGIFRDEFYYIACSERLAWGYVDHPPLSIALLKLSRIILGNSVEMIRFLPAVSGVILIWLTWLITHELGGKIYAKTLAAVAVIIAPSYLIFNGFFSMNSFDLLFWAISYYILLKIIATGEKKLWLALGIAAGFGLMNKLSMVFFGISLAASLLLTKERKWFLSPWLWTGFIVAVIIFLPHILWQVQNGWPTLEFMSNAKHYKIAEITPLQFLLAQGELLHPFNMPIWICGLVFLLFMKNGRFRLIGLVFLFTLIFLALQKSKPYYLVPAYSPLLGAGAVFFESVFSGIAGKLLKPALIVLLLAGGIISAPLALPLLPVENLIAYQKILGIKVSSDEKHNMGLLMQPFADRFGWKEMAATVYGVFSSLTPEQKTDCAIVTENYGEAGALEYYGREFRLPPVLCTHNNYYLWGYRGFTGDVIIKVGGDENDLRKVFDNVVLSAKTGCRYAMPYENNLPVYICTGLKIPLAEAWIAGKHFL